MLFPIIALKAAGAIIDDVLGEFESAPPEAVS
jgi:hypothetical protein